MWTFLRHQTQTPTSLKFSKSFYWFIFCLNYVTHIACFFTYSIFHRIFISLVYDDVEEMKHYAKKYFETTMPTWFLQSGFAAHTFYIGLASFRIYRETREELWAQRARNSRERIQSWNEQGSKWNFQHKLELMEAEEAYSNGDFRSAHDLYDKAVLSAKQHKFIIDEALANELAAKFHLAIGNNLIALEYFIEAHEKYYEWNAFAKVKSLYASIQEKFRGTSTIVERIPGMGSTSAETETVAFSNFE